MIEKGKQELYPAQMFSAQRMKTTLAVDNNFMPPSTADGSDDPFLGLHSGLSRVTVHIIDTEASFKGVRANLRGNEIPYLLDQYRAVCVSRLLCQQSEVAQTDATEEEPSIAYTEKLKFGLLKGLTPAEVILSKGDDGVKELAKTKEFLASKLSQFPTNQAAIDAIDDAIFLNDTGALKPCAEVKKTSSSHQVVLLDKKFKAMSGGKIRAAIKIYADFAHTIPWKIWIENADVKVGSSDTSIENAEVDNVRYLLFALTEEEMSGFIHAISTNLNLFEMIHYKGLWDRSAQARWKPGE